MGLLSMFLSLAGLGWGISVGLIVGYFIFIYFQPMDVKKPIIRPFSEMDSKSLQSLLPEIPLWVKNPDYDRVDWLNSFVADIWPYLDKAICEIIWETAKPYIEEYAPKFKLESLEFESLTLGSLPPTLVGVKVYDTQEQEIVIEPSLKWAGTPNIVLAAKGYGLKATAQMVDIQIFATARVTLKPLIPVFPCFSKIIVSLMEKPHIDFGLKLLGGDLMAIPGLYSFVQEFIKEQVSGMYLWPETLEISVLDDPMAEKKPVGILHVNVVRATNLKRKDVLGKSDPYVTLKLGEGKLRMKKTTIKMNTLNPEWNESFHMVVQDPEVQALELHVYDWEKVGHPNKLGMQVIPLKNLTPGDTKTLTLDLLKNMDPNDPANQKHRGQLTLELTYKLFKEDDVVPDGENDGIGVEKAPKGTPQSGGLLVVTIHSGQGLEGKHHNNPYAKVLFRGEQRKTQVVKKNRDPRWEAEFEFVCEEPPVNDQLRIEVASKSNGIHLHTRESLGYVEIGLGDVVNNKRINEKYQLIESKNGKVAVELVWRPG